MIRTAIIGLGKMGLSHASIINAHPNLNLVSVCDTSTLILEAMKKYTPVQIYTDYKKMIDDSNLDALFVATPTKFHTDMVMYALEQNIHVFCEKPFSLTYAQGKMMVEKAQENKLVNQVGYHNRFVGTFNHVKALLAQKAIGSVFHFMGEAYGPVVVKPKDSTWRSDAKEGGGCLFDYASHVLNLIEYILDDIKDVDGMLLKRIFSKKVEDAVYGSLHLKNGLSGSLSVNWSDETYRKMSTQITLLGTEGKIISDAHEMKIYLKKDKPELGMEKGWNMRYITDVTEGVEFNLRGEEYSAQVDYFAKCIMENNLNNINSFASALNTDKVIETIKTNYDN